MQYVVITITINTIQYIYYNLQYNLLYYHYYNLLPYSWLFSLGFNFRDSNLSRESYFCINFVECSPLF